MADKVNRILDAAKNLGGQAQEAAGQGAGALRDFAERAGDLAQVGADTLRALTDEVNELLPAIRKAGYLVQGVDLDVAIPPKVSVHCKLQTDLSEEERVALLASLEGRKLVETAVAALFRVADAQRRLSLGTLRPSDIILEMGVTPGVKVRYREPGGGGPA
jgi:hypothetical protein